MERIRTLSRPHDRHRVRSGNAGANNKAIVICGDRSTLYFEHTKLNIHLNQTVRELSNESRSIVVEVTELTDSISTTPAPKYRDISRGLIDHIECCGMQTCIKFIINQRNSERNYAKLRFPHGLQGPRLLTQIS